MYWNYRVVELNDGSGFVIREVHYNDNGTVIGTCSPNLGVSNYVDDCHPSDDAIADATPIKTIAAELQRVLHDITNPDVPIFKEPKEWGEDKETKALLNLQMTELASLPGVVIVPSGESL